MGSGLSFLVLLILFGCQGPQDASSPGGGGGIGPTPPNRTVRAAPARPETADAPPVTTVVDARPAVVINGKYFTWGELRPYLSEAAGGAAIQELILDRRLEGLTAEAGVEITADDEAAEQQLLLKTLSDDPNRAVRLLDELRDVQRLGPVRYRALLHRNASLRALVRDRVAVSEATIEQMFDARYGAKRQVRLLTTADLAQAEEAIARIASGAFFGEVAVELSTDASASRGGLLEPFSRNDPSYPSSIRTAVWALEGAGDVSDPILLERGYAVAQLVEHIEPALASIDDADRDELERLARMRAERLLMDELAQRIIRDSSVMIFDPQLEDGWERHQRRIGLQ
jgi:parvulin-like peptidyl-prolyl isomerase